MVPALRYRVGASEEIVALARRRLGLRSAVYYAPDIPPLKEAIVRGVHAGYLADDEPILVVHDATLLGGGENGFVITQERVCWKNLLEHPRQIPWKELDASTIVAGLGCVDIAGGTMIVSGELAPQAAQLLVDVARRCHAPQGGPYRVVGEPVEGASPGVSVLRLTSLARQHVGEVEALYYDPAIPRLKLRRARVTHAASLPRGEPVALLYDDTLFGGAEDGLVITPARLCWKNLATEARSVRWDALDPHDVQASGNVLHVTGGTIHFSRHAELAHAVAGMLLAVLGDLRRA